MKQTLNKVRFCLTNSRGKLNFRLLLCWLQKCQTCSTRKCTAHKNSADDINGFSVPHLEPHSVMLIINMMKKTYWCTTDKSYRTPTTNKRQKQKIKSIHFYSNVDLIKHSTHWLIEKCHHSASIRTETDSN